MGLPPSLNITYLFVKAYQYFSGISLSSPDSIPRSVTIIADDVGVIGMVIAILLFVFLVYLQIRMVQVEYGGFEHWEEEKRKRREQEIHAGTDSRWDTVMTLVSSDNEGDWRRAILEADIMLGDLLQARGYPGDTLGDQLKAANPLHFTTINQAWGAHKMRNTIAHLGEAFPLTQRDAQETIQLYRQVFEEFGIL